MEIRREKFDNSGHSCVFLRVDPFSPIASFFFVVVTTGSMGRDKGAKKCKKNSNGFSASSTLIRTKAFLRNLSSFAGLFSTTFWP